ncbi:GTPase RhebL1-like [Symsagittifera roscoffensis]|uniref:GTPase RhebL1-like n=1 Tax=Symsagittifera roscoffensis TaxID=84072 RepID=UPI00307B86A8
MSSKSTSGRSGGKRQRNIAVLGYWNVGKTSVVQRYVHDAFTPKYFPTIEQTYQKTLAFQNMEIDLMITDTAGQEEYSLLPTHALQSCDGYLLVYAVNDINSFEGLKNIYKKLQETIGTSRPIIVVGNKLDLGDRQVPFEKGKELATRWDMLFAECSACSGEGVEEIFTNILAHIERERRLVYLGTRSPRSDKCRLM